MNFETTKAFKGTIAPKNINLIERNPIETLRLFKGFTNFLSFLTMKGEEIASCLRK